jgi:tRNA/tmRNA/rRNA uracil-C5-methylase (TrmA/RlmC/RlmD family)
LSETTPELLELELGDPSAGGGFVARDSGGRVVFVRHGLPGERVRAVVAESHATWARADVVEVLEASAERVETPCPHAGAGACGGCDYQHVSLGAQRELKTTLLAAQLRRVEGLGGHAHAHVEGVGDGDGLGTRTRVRFAVGQGGSLCMRRHRSHGLVEVGECPLGVRALGALESVAVGRRSGDELEAMVLPDSDTPTAWVRRRDARGRRATSTLRGDGLADRQVARVRGAHFVVSAGVFWQVHERAAPLLADEVIEGLALGAGDRVADLYCGAGLFARVAADGVGPTGTVTGVDGATAAVRDARENLRDVPWARAYAVRVDGSSAARALEGATHVVLDPPRSGVDRAALAAVVSSPTARTVVSVSCDPATFARDLGVLLEGGWRVETLRAFDLFEMTEHFECVAVLRR